MTPKKKTRTAVKAKIATSLGRGPNRYAKLVEANQRHARWWVNYLGWVIPVGPLARSATMSR